ncbi:ABC transporter permease [Dactylosporangium fulvum]|uniref:ABC transporter permease n=1 Tax=Dactylosporangium fulvum TaxID=53359 RepID=A0ABY5VW45_9ACTN|nr:ABC transporter permease [Dactylosporangium fulvum]UWP81820.1 ABC transporter permease [Dactylosporangium fulvum]
MSNPTLATKAPQGVQEITTRQRSQFELVIRRFLRHRLAVGSLVVFLLIVLFAFVGPLVWKYDHTYIDGPSFSPPSAEYPLGTDQAGHDLLGQSMRGTQQSLKISLVVALIATTFGSLWGAIAGFYRGWLDGLLMRIADVVLTLPSIAIAVTLAVNIRGGARWWGLALVLSFLAWAGISRVVRGVVLSLREQEFVEAAKAMGASDMRIILRHLLPNALGPIIVAATVTIATTILSETALSFIGFGVQRPDTSLGLLINDAKLSVQDQPWLFYFPGLFIILIALTVNFVGDGLRDAFDPRQTLVRR